MKLISLKLHNFRQFYGTTPALTFSTSDKNVTVIHGVNGAGKTALLNAFTWILFNRFSRGFKHPDQLVNKRAIREAQLGQTVECWGTLVFEHDDCRYELRRSAEVVKTSESEWPLRAKEPSLKYCGADGVWHGAIDVAAKVGRILPEDLHSYFFFDGERIEKLTDPPKEERADLTRATKTLLGVEILDRAERHLRSAQKDFEAEFASEGDAESKDLVERKKKAEKDLETANLRISEIDTEITSHRRVRDELREQLRRVAEAANDQLRRDQLEKDEIARIESIKQNRVSLAAEISAHGHAVFLSGATKHFRDLVDSLRQKGELPAGIKRQFVNDRLALGVCICDRRIDASEPKARQAVENWLNRAGLADVEEKAIRMGGEVEIIESLIPTFWTRVDDIQQRNETDMAELKRIQVELEGIRKKLENSPKEEVSGLEKRLKATDDKIDSLNKELGDKRHDAEDATERIADLEAKIRHAHVANARQQKAMARSAASADAASRIQKVRSLLEEQFRQSLEKRIRNLFHKISVTPYVPRLKTDYALDLVESAGGATALVAHSQGESLVLSFSFIGAMIEEAREYTTKREQLPGPDSSKFPLVMDSPFGALDEEHRRHIAENIGRLADQVITLVSKTQWRNEVETALGPRIGKSYVLCYFTPRDDIKPASMSVGSQSYDLVKQSPNEFEYTEIIEV